MIISRVKNILYSLWSWRSSRFMKYIFAMLLIIFVYSEVIYYVKIILIVEEYLLNIPTQLNVLSPYK